MPLFPTAPTFIVKLPYYYPNSQSTLLHWLTGVVTGHLVSCQAVNCSSDNQHLGFLKSIQATFTPVAKLKVVVPSTTKIFSS